MRPGFSWGYKGSGALLLASALALAGCGDDGTTDSGIPDDGGVDGSMDDGGPFDSGIDDGGPTDGRVDDGGTDDGSPGDGGTGDGGDASVDGGPGDGGPGDAAVETVTLTGVVNGEAVGDPPVAPPIAGATVSILLLDGTLFDTTTTAADGSYTLTAPRRSIVFHRVDPVPGYLGGLRGERAGSIDYMAYEVRLPRTDGVVAIVASSGAIYDSMLGYAVVGFNPVSYMDGGEGATLSGVTHDPAFIAYPGGVQVTNVLPRICGVGEDPTTDGCAPDGRLNQVFFPNLDGSDTMMSIINPAGGTCTERFGITSWPVFADTWIKINVDCS